MTIRLPVSILFAGVVLAANANATEFYIDEFRISKGTIDSWFVDPFDDGNEPPTSEGQFPNLVSGLYDTRPDPMPGPEQNGKLKLDSSQGQSVNSSVTGTPVLQQRARLLTDISSDLTRGLKTDDVFTVTGVFDLIRPQLVNERYGIRLTDFGSGTVDDNIQIGLVLLSGGDWVVGFRQADFVGKSFNLLDNDILSDRADIGDFEQIALSLTKASASSNVITASYALIDEQDPLNPVVVGLSGAPEIFHGEPWTRAEFAVSQVVPIPTALPLFASALGIISIPGWRRRKNA